MGALHTANARRDRPVAEAQVDRFWGDADRAAHGRLFFESLVKTLQGRRLR
jgi:hypothetical protein